MAEEEKEKDAIKELSSALIENLLKYGEIELEGITIEAGEVEIWLQSALPPAVRRRLAPLMEAKPEEIIEFDFVPPEMRWPGSVVEVKLGATGAEGGTRSNSIVIGGETLPPYYMPGNPTPHAPVVAFDVFDMKISLPKAIRTHFEDVMESPGEWAERCVGKYGAEMINLHLVSTDPLVKDTSPSQAAKTVEEVLQAVNVPLTVGGSGDPKKDAEVFAKVTEVGEGERLLINSLNLDMDLEEAAKPIREHDHVAIAFSPMDLDKARELNRKLYEYLPKDRIVMDSNTAGIGYGIQYGFTVMERARLAALKGDEELQHPLAAGVTNAWAAREAWMKMDPKWGPREIRGPIWEFLTALSLLLAGADYFMMMHPESVNALRDVINSLMKGEESEEQEIRDWISADLGG